MLIKLTDGQRGEIRDRANRATPGFWDFWDCNHTVPHEDNDGRYGVQQLTAAPRPLDNYGDNDTIPTVEILEALFDGEVTELDDKYGAAKSPVGAGIVRVINPHDLPFIAKARQDIPNLLDTCEVLQSESEGAGIALADAYEAMADQKRRIDTLTNRLFSERRDTGNLAIETMNTLCAALLELADKDGVQLPERIRSNAGRIATAVWRLVADREEWDVKYLQPVWSAERVTQTQEGHSG